MKTGLVVYDDSAPLPVLTSLTHTLNDKQLSITVNIQGGSGSVAYQIDRALIEPECKCIGNWLRYYESSASMNRQSLTRHFKRYAHRSHAYRVRVIDQLGRVTGWSKIIKVVATDAATNNDSIKTNSNETNPNEIIHEQ
ncbi:MAG: hypothetical protein R8M46_07385 [Ghiorsea sp.]